MSLLAPEGAEAGRVRKRLLERGVAVNYRAGRVRVSPHAYNTAEEIDRTVELLKGLS